MARGIKYAQWSSTVSLITSRAGMGSASSSPDGLKVNGERRKLPKGNLGGSIRKSNSYRSDKINTCSTIAPFPQVVGENFCIKKYLAVNV